MTKRNKIIFWVATAWLSLGMLSTGIVQLIQMEEEIESFSSLGYPGYLLPLMGIWKILGVIAVLIPKFPVLKRMGLCRVFLCYVRSYYFACCIG